MSSYAPPAGIVDLLESTEGILVATTAVLVAAGAALAAALRGWRWLKREIGSLQVSAGQTLHQVKNDHPQNFRDDMDQKFQSVHEKIDRLAIGVDELHRSDTRQWQRTADLARKDDRLDNRVAALEWQQVTEDQTE